MQTMGFLLIHSRDDSLALNCTKLCLLLMHVVLINNHTNNHTCDYIFHTAKNCCPVIILYLLEMGLLLNKFVPLCIKTVCNSI